MTEERESNTQQSAAQEPKPSPIQSLDDRLFSTVTTGLIVVAVFFVGLGAWAVTAPISSAAVASGVISPDSSRKTVQHLEGGIIDELLVKNGDHVERGKSLVVLQDIQAKSNYQMVRAQYLSKSAIEIRLHQSQLDVESLSFPAWLQEQVAGDPFVRDLLQNQRELFQVRRQNYNERISILGQRIERLAEEHIGLEKQYEAEKQGVALIQEELRGVRHLVSKGIERKKRQIDLQRQEAKGTAEMAEIEAALARTRQQINETELQIVNEKTQRLDDLAAELEPVRTELSTLRDQMRAQRDILKRTTVTAPVSGTVVQLRYKTPGGVITPGKPILDIVPDKDELLIDSDVSPLDRDSVEVGAPTQIYLLGFSQRNLPPIHGKVISISADSLVDEVTGNRYYRARVRVNDKDLERVREEVKMTAGMPAEVIIHSGERTFAQYLFGPLQKSLRRSFREG